MRAMPLKMARRRVRLLILAGLALKIKWLFSLKVAAKTALKIQWA
jgi:hypothetical protein